MKKKNRFFLSQAAHKRLAEKHKQSKRDDSWIGEAYHNDVYMKQTRAGRVLTKAERKKVYDSARYYFYN